MSRRNILVLVALIFVLIIVGLAGFLLLKTNTSSSQTSTSLRNANTQTKFQFISQIPEFKLTPNGAQNATLQEVLTKLGLYPFLNLPYIGEPGANGSWDGTQRTVSPTQVDVTIYPMSMLTNNADLQKRGLLTLNGTDGKPMIAYLAGHQSTDGKFSIPIYIEANSYIDFNKKRRVDIKLNQDVLMGFFLNFQVGPYPSGNQFQIFEDKIGGSLPGLLFDVNRN